MTSSTSFFTNKHNRNLEWVSKRNFSIKIGKLIQCDCIILIFVFISLNVFKEVGEKRFQDSRSNQNGYWILLLSRPHFYWIFQMKLSVKWLSWFLFEVYFVSWVQISKKPETWKPKLIKIVDFQPFIKDLQYVK